MSNINSHRFQMGMIAPALIVVFGVNLFPIFYALYMSVHFWTLSGVNPPRWAGFANYIDLMTDERFLSSIATSFKITATAVSLEMVLGIALAFLFNAQLRMLGALRTLYFLPVMAMPLIAGLVWFYMLNQNYGTINGLLAQFGFPTISFLTDDLLAMLSIVIVDVWQWTPFVMIIVLAALQSRPKSVYEAARMDGMNEPQIFWKITLPLLRSTLMVILVFRLVDAFKIVEYVFLMTKGGPAGVTETAPWYIYVTGFQSSDLGYAGAMSIVVIIIVTIISQILVRAMEKGEGE